MTTYVYRECKTCGECSSVDKSLLYSGYTLKCGHSQCDEAPVRLGGGIMDAARIGIKSTSSEFKNFVDKVMSQKGARNDLRKY